MSTQPEALSEQEAAHIYRMRDEIMRQENEMYLLRQQIERLSAELERERMRLAACAVVALADTPDSAKHARQMHPDYESAACQDVARRVDECISLRTQRDALLEACRAYDKWADKTLCYDRELRPIRAQIRAAIKQAEGENT